MNTVFEADVKFDKEPMDPENSRKSSKKAKDRISQLPDDILHRIISHLPTNYAIGTCILSTRWRNVWLGISNLYFSDKHYFANGASNDTLKFVDFVDKTFLLRAANVINKFRLSCGMCLCCIKPWISYMLSCKVEEVSLKAMVKGSLILPLDLLNCKSLKINSSLSIFTVPSSVCMSVMKVLHLCNVKFTCNQEIQIFCCTCPVLEELKLNCEWDYIKSVIFHAPTLKRLTISADDYPGEDDDFEIEFHAECLISLHVTTCKPYNLSLPNLTSLREAILDFAVLKEHECVNIVLEAISSVHHLTLSDTAIQELSEGGLFTKLLALSSLKSLTIEMSSDGEIINGEVLSALFRNLPNIETLVFVGGLAICDGRYLYDDEDLVIGETYGWRVETTPQPTMPYLNSVKLYDFYGSWIELGLVKFLLKNAKVLEKIEVTSSATLSADPEKHLEFTKQLQWLSTLSKTCLVEFA